MKLGQLSLIVLTSFIFGAAGGVTGATYLVRTDPFVIRNLSSIVAQKFVTQSVDEIRTRALYLIDSSGVERVKLMMTKKELPEIPTLINRVGLETGYELMAKGTEHPVMEFCNDDGFPLLRVGRGASHHAGIELFSPGGLPSRTHIRPDGIETYYLNALDEPVMGQAHISANAIGASLHLEGLTDSKSTTMDLNAMHDSSDIEMTAVHKDAEAPVIQQIKLGASVNDPNAPRAFGSQDRVNIELSQKHSGKKTYDSLSIDSDGLLIMSGVPDFNHPDVSNALTGGRLDQVKENLRKTLRLDLGLDNNLDPRLILYDTKGESRLVAGAVELRHSTSDATTRRSPGSLVIFNKKGKVSWISPD